MPKGARRGKIFVDYLRNNRGSTSVEAYSIRARAGAPVAMPISWKDVAAVDPRELTMKTVPKIVARRKKDPWARYHELAQRLPRLSVRDSS